MVKSEKRDQENDVRDWLTIFEPIELVPESPLKANTDYYIQVRLLKYPRRSVSLLAILPGGSSDLTGRSATFPVKLEAGPWYTLVVETVGEEMRVTIDGKPAGYLKSSGIGHATKSKIELGVAGKDGFFDDLKVWNAEPAKR